MKPAPAGPAMLQPAGRSTAPWTLPFGKLEKTTLTVAVLWILCALLAPSLWVKPVLQLLLWVLAAWTAVRWTRRLVQRAIWRLRNRLLLSYVFIAVVPVMLLCVLGIFGVWTIAGQVAVYLVSSEFERALSLMQGASASVLRAPPARRGDAGGRLYGFLNDRFPGMRMLISSPGMPPLHFPEDDDLTPPPPSAPETGGLLKRDGQLYGWAHHKTENGEFIAIAPITRKYLLGLVPNIGDITIIDYGSADGRRARLRLLDAPTEDPENVFAAHSIAPAVNALDYQVLWGMQMPVTDWDHPAVQDGVLLGVHTRISQVFRVVFSRKADWDQPWLIYAFYTVAIVFICVEFVALIVGISITRSMTAAVHNLYEGTGRIQAGDFAHRIPVQGHDQLADLGLSFNTMTMNLEHLLKVAQEKERLQADLDIAEEVQKQLYPSAAPQLERLEITARVDAARSVSGDYYDYQQLPGGKVAIALGDVAGKGISAAILMAIVQSSLRAQLRGPDADFRPSIVVEQLNRHLHAHTSSEKYSTFFFGVIDEATGRLTATNAGHLPPILVRNGTAARLDVNGMVVGAFPSATYTESVVELERGDVLVLFTDGLTEPENEYEEMFGEDQLVETVVRMAGRSNQELIDEVFTAVSQWTYSPGSRDDMSILVVRRL